MKAFHDAQYFSCMFYLTFKTSPHLLRAMFLLSQEMALYTTVVNSY
jgi:hypothetical protein